MVTLTVPEDPRPMTCPYFVVDTVRAMSSLLITSHHEVRRIDIFLLQFARFSNHRHWSVLDPFELAAALIIAKFALQLELLLGTTSPRHSIPYQGTQRDLYNSADMCCEHNSTVLLRGVI